MAASDKPKTNEITVDWSMADDGSITLNGADDLPVFTETMLAHNSGVSDA